MAKLCDGSRWFTLDAFGEPSYQMVLKDLEVNVGFAFAQYNNPSTWGLSYNLYADKLLGLNLFPTSVYTMRTSVLLVIRGERAGPQAFALITETAWYKTVEAAYGIPLDTR